MELKLASLGHISLDGSKFKANSSKHKAMRYKRLKEKEQALTAEIEALIEKASHCDEEEDNTFTCPGGQRLEMKRASQDGTRIYQGEAKTCANCPYQSRCCQSKNGSARSITCDDKEPLRQQMNSKIDKDEAKAVYKERKIIVEPVFGQIKNTGFRGFSVRGKEKAAGEFSLVCAVHNIKKIAKAIIRGVVRPESGKLVENHGI